jgi:hypothetical protein
MRRDDIEVMKEFLKARLREDEEAARALKLGKSEDLAKLQARVLADVEAKWQLLTWVEEYPRIVQENPQPTLWRRARAQLLAGLSQDFRSPVVFELVAAYADHPDFRPEWLPIEDEQRQQGHSA